MAKETTRPADRRGVFSDDGGNPWFMVLVQMPGRTGPVDLDEVVARLTARGMVTSSQRDVGAELHAKRLLTPIGKWGLLIALPGQPWAYLTTSFDSSGLPAEIAKQTGLRTIGAGYQDTANATTFQCFEGQETLVQYESCGGDEIVEQYGDDPDQVWNQTVFTSTRLPQGWIDKFKSEHAVLNALAKEFDAFIPYIGARGQRKEAVELSGFDRKQFKGTDYLRIDLLGFEEPDVAGFQLLHAIEDGDIEAIRAAVAAGANLHRLPKQEISPVSLALNARPDRKPRRPLVAALLELGARVQEPDEEPVVIVPLDQFCHDASELIDLLDLLLAHGADVNAPGRKPYTLPQGQTPLHMAVNRGRAEVAKFLLSKGADPCATNLDGLTPAQRAQECSDRLKEVSPEGAAEYEAMIPFLAAAEAAARLGKPPVAGTRRTSKAPKRLGRND